MANTSARTLRLLSLLQRHRDWTGAELAERLGVSARTLRRDVDRLRELGYPVEARRGVDGGYQLGAGAAMPPLLLDDDEAVALVVGLHHAAQSMVAGLAESSVRALAKVAQVMPAPLRHHVDALGSMTVPASWESAGAAVDPAVLTAVAGACRDTVRLSFAYTSRDGAGTDRYVEPHRLVLLGRRWYLAAYDVDRADWRTFRLDRMRDPRPTRGRFDPRPVPGGDAAAYVRQGIDSVVAAHEVDVIVQAPAAEVAVHVGRWGHVGELDGARCRLTMTAESLQWPAMVLGAIGAEFTVVAPPELRELVAEWGRRFSVASAG